MKTIDAKLADANANTRISRTYTLGAEVGMYPTIVTELVEKKRGARPIAVVPTYCPWCGLHYKTGRPGAAKAEG